MPSEDPQLRRSQNDFLGQLQSTTIAGCLGRITIPMSWGSQLVTVLEVLGEHDFSSSTFRSHPRGAWLLQESHKVCGPGSVDPECQLENFHILMLVALLCTLIAFALCALCSIHEDKEDQLVPLCPQLIVKETPLKFKLPLDGGKDEMEVTDLADALICKLVMDWPDPFRPGFSGVDATVRLQTVFDVTLATVVARSVAVAGQGLALCRAGCEIFGFVEPDPFDSRRFTVRHRSSVELLKLYGDFDSPNLAVTMLNPIGKEICSVRRIGDVCYGQVHPHVDAGLALCCLLAGHVNCLLPKMQAARASQDSADEGENPSTDSVTSFSRNEDA